MTRPVNAARGERLESRRKIGLPESSHGMGYHEGGAKAEIKRMARRRKEGESEGDNAAREETCAKSPPIITHGVKIYRMATTRRPLCPAVLRATSISPIARPRARVVAFSISGGGGEK